MSHQRGPSSTNVSGPHSVSLKVLRLSRPSLATQTPLPPTSFGHGLDIPTNASLAYASNDDRGKDNEHASSFPLTPLLTLPATFGAAYVGERFACALCANNELRDTDRRSVSGLKITAELQTPGEQGAVALELAGGQEDGGDPAAEEAEDEEFTPGTTRQRTLAYDLKDEGQHVLVVTVTYYETQHGEEGGPASGGRVRTFRKLYQFVSQQLIAVRSKVTERKRREKEGLRQWILEAQLENVGEASVVVEKVSLSEREGIRSVAVNAAEETDSVVLKPQDVEQVMFMLSEEAVSKEVGSRVPLAQLHIDWRSAMGERGSLTTGWLASRGR